MAKDINIGGRLHSIATGNVVAGADEILDDNLGKKQTQINTETYSLVESVNNALDALNPDQQEALGVAAKANANEAKLGYYVCDTDADTAAKTVVATNYVLGTGGSMKVKMTNANTADAVTLNINSTGAKALFYNGEQANANNSWEAGEVVEVYYDGTKYQCGGRVVDNEPTAGSNNLVKSGGVYNEVKNLYDEVKNFNGSETNNEEDDLSISDNNNMAIVKFKNGHIITKNFNSEQTTTKLESIEVGAEVNNTASESDLAGDFAITDDNGKAILQIKNGYVITKNFNSEQATKKIKLLFVGNSYSRDAVMYVPKMLSSLGISYKIGILYHAGCTLQMHVENIGTEYYTYNYNENNEWLTVDNVTLEYGVKEDDWDFISFQQGSNKSGYISLSYLTPYLDTLLNTVNTYLLESSKFKGSVEFVWLATPAYSTEALVSTGNTNYQTSDEMYEDIIRLSEYVVEHYPVIKYYIPESTSIQNAVHTTLAQYTGESVGDTSGKGGALHYNNHLLEGIGRQVASYSVLYSIFKCSPLGNKVRITSSTGMIEPHNTPVGSTDENSYIAQKCAIAAIKNPNELTTL